MWRESEQLGTRTQDPYLVLRPISREISVAIVDGELERAVELAAQGVARAEEAGSAALGLQEDGNRALPARLYLGRPQQGLDSLRRMQEAVLGTRGDQLLAGLCLAHLGRNGEARAILEDYIRESHGAPGPASSVRVLRLALDLAVQLRDGDAARLVVGVLAPLADQLSTGGRDLGCIGRHLGDAAALLGDREAARAYYQQGLEVCRKVRFRPEIALIRLGLAELLLNGSPEEQAEAQDHLDFAIEELRAMKMQPSLERALRHKGLLKA